MSDTLKMVLAVTAGVLAAAAGLVLLGALLFPTEASQVGLGIGGLVAGTRDQLDALRDLTGLSLGADLLLLGAAYILVCMFLWIQAEARTYLANRSHFE